MLVVASVCAALKHLELFLIVLKTGNLGGTASKTRPLIRTGFFIFFTEKQANAKKNTMTRTRFLRTGLKEREGC